MTVPIKRFAFNDLSKMKLGDAKNTLDFSFVNARVDMVYADNSWEPKEVQFPDLIRFSKHKELVKVIKSSIKRIFHLTTCSKNAQFGSRHYGDYEMPAKDWKVFFHAIKKLQEKQSSICIPKAMFQRTLNALCEHKHITDSDKKKLQEDIQTGLTLEEYKRKADFGLENALALAYYYINYIKGPYCTDSSIYWLCEAKKYLGNGRLGELIDLDAFFLNFKKINYAGVFEENLTEIVEAIARCPSIKEFSPSSHTDYNLQLAEGIGSFLTKANYIDTVYLSSNVCKVRLNAKTITPIAEALSVNSSIQKFQLVDQYICDEGLVKIIEAIESNPKSKITSLAFNDCGLGEEGATKLLEFCKKMDQITEVLIRGNEKISAQLLLEFDQFLMKKGLSKS